ncbi:uncharacterized protein LOC130238587 [Danio aesculapii]|uniref:uncharacterized protein LOC130238587 n=1 Tax=Danio aesculapii TaxID=1142201 RepID=UPI0024C007F1|nr:uncharacterized protein LOC130238587 [Danio aesculapii]
MTFRLLLSFFLLTHNTGFSAEISVFVQTGDSVQLDIQTQQLPEFEHLFWIDEKSESIVKYNYDDKKFKFYDSYKERVYFNDTSFSLTLKNTQKIDSGLYTARISGKLNKDILTCKVSVIDEVEAPVLAVNSNWSSSELCSFTCSGRDINISSIHNSSSCPEEEVTSADYHTIRMNCNNTFIMCNYSNPVSWKTDIKKVHELCTVYPGYSVDAQMNIPTKVYENVDENKPQKSPEIPPTSVKENNKSAGPVTIYCTIEKQPDQPKPETENTIYAVVKKPFPGFESPN